MSTIFSAYDIRGVAGDTLSTELAWNVGKAFAEWLPDEGPVVLVMAPTTDLSTVHAITEGLLLQGRDVIEGQGTTQLVNDYISDKKVVGGVYVNHEAADNNEVIQLFDATGTAVTDQTGLTDIAQLVESGNFLPAAEKGKVSPLDKR